MRHIKSYLVRDHLACDDLLAAVEAALGAEDWATLVHGTDELIAALATHFAKEEEVLFPFFDAGERSTTQVTDVLRAEHRRMMAVARDLKSASARRDAPAMEEGIRQLGRIMERHNANEEIHMFTSGDELFGAHADRLIARMESIAESRRDGQA